ncbi:hypothetical protein IGI42_000065 [Enterococcus sp. AZ109]
MHFAEIALTSEKLAEVKAIYYSSFPEKEQHPFDWLVKKAQQEKGHFAGLIHENQVIGMTYYTVNEGIVYVFYFAIDPTIRSQGYGQQMMQALQEKFLGCKLMLLIEEILETAANNAERIRRKDFYLTNGFESKNDFVEVLGATFELLHLKSVNSSIKDYRKIKTYFYSEHQISD